MGLDERLARFRDEAVAESPPPLDVERAFHEVTERRVRRHRQRRTAALGVLTVAALVVGAVLVAAPWAADEREAVVTADGGDGEPGPLDDLPSDTPYLWVSATEVPRGTAELAVALVNPTDQESPTFGVGGELERWDGTEWEPYRLVRLCVDHWLCRGDLFRPGDEVGIRDIGLLAPPNGVGPTLWLPAGELEVASYRLTIDGNDRGPDGELLPVTATGRFDVVTADAVGQLPPPRPLDGPGLVTAPPIVNPSGGAVQLDIAGVGSSAELDSLWGSVTEQPLLERWTGTEWELVQELGALAAVDDQPITRVVDVPALDDGAFRVVVPVANGSDLEGRLWVERLFDDGQSSPPSTATPTSTPNPAGVPAVPLVIAFRDRLELWDGDTAEPVRVLTTAGQGRPPVTESYRLGPVSLGAGAAWFTEYAGPEDQPSIWRVDLATGERMLVVEDADWPAISPDGTRLAYAAGIGQRPYPGVAQQIGILPIGSDAEAQVIDSYDTGGGPPGPATIQHLEWSPDGTRLLFADRYENAIVGVLDPSTNPGLSDAVFLTDENVAPTWVDDETIATGQYCCYAQEQRPLEYVLSDARTGEVIGSAEGADGTPLEMAADPNGRLIILMEVVRDQPVGILAVPSPDGAIEIEGVRSADW